MCSILDWCILYCKESFVKMKWSPKHDRFIVDKEIKKQRKDQWVREFDRVILFLFIISISLGAVTCGLIYYFSK